MRMLHSKAIPFTFFATMLFVVFLFFWGILESIEAREIPTQRRTDFYNPWALGDAIPASAFMRRTADEFPMESRENAGGSSNSTPSKSTGETQPPATASNSSDVVKMDHDVPANENPPILRVPIEDSTQPSFSTTPAATTEHEIFLPEEDPTLPKPPKPTNFLAPIISEFLPVLVRSFFKDFLIPRASDILGFMQSGITTFFQNIALLLSQMFPGLTGLFFRNGLPAQQQQVAPSLLDASSEFQKMYSYSDLGGTGDQQQQDGYYPSPHSLVPDDSYYLPNEAASRYPTQPARNFQYVPYDDPAGPELPNDGFIQPGVTVYDHDQLSTSTVMMDKGALSGGQLDPAGVISNGVDGYQPLPVSAESYPQQGPQVWGDERPKVRWFSTSRFGDRFKKLRQKELEEQQQREQQAPHQP